MTSYSRQEVLRILQISSRQLQGWERAELIPSKQSYSFQDLGQLRTLRILREEEVPAASIRLSIMAMKAVSGMSNPLIEASPVRTGTRLAFRHHGAIMDPIRRQLIFDFERMGRKDATTGPSPLRPFGKGISSNVQDLFLSAVQFEESGDKPHAIALYDQILEIDPAYAPAYINLGTIAFHLRQFQQAEDLYRRATVADPNYVLAFFDLGNVLDELERLDESIAAYRQAVALAPRYADVHYNLALAYERTGEYRSALRHWEAYVKLDGNGPWADHAHGQIHKILSRDKLSIAWRKDGFVRRSKGKAALHLISAKLGLSPVDR